MADFVRAPLTVPGSKRRPLRVLAALLSTFLVAACFEPRSPEYVYRYRLTLELEVDGEVRRGSSVVQMRHYKRSRFSIGAPNASAEQVTGQAVAIPLGEQRVLYALLVGFLLDYSGQGEGGREWVGFGPETILGPYYGLKLAWRDGRSPGLAALTRKRDVIPLTTNQLPRLVILDDYTDFYSLRPVDPDDLPEDLRLISATLELTSDPVTETYDEYMPWADETLQLIDPQTGGRYNTVHFRW